MSILRKEFSLKELVAYKYSQNIAILIITILTFLLKLKDLAKPYMPVFDEVYYIRNALDLIKNKVEFNSYSKVYSLVVHPPLGKWMLTPGILIFGDNSFGWRITALLWGTLAVALVGFITKILFNNFTVTFLATLYMGIDGISFTNSRTGILESPLTFLTLLTLYLFIRGLKNPRYLNLYGISIGLALGVKWSAIYQILAYTFIYLIYTSPRVRYYYLKKRYKQIIKFKLSLLKNFLFLPLLTYIATWSGWFLTKTGQFRTWGEEHRSAYPLIPNVIRSFWHYHAVVYDFHQKLTSYHPAQAHPYQWLLGNRPTTFFKEGGVNCNLTQPCGSTITQFPNLFILYGSIIAFVLATIILLRSYIKYRNFEYKLFILTTLTLFSFLPWLLIPKRTTYTYYIDTFLPFMIILLAYIFNRINCKLKNKKIKDYMVALFLIIPIAFFIYYYPLYISTLEPYSYLNLHYWLSPQLKYLP